MKTRQVKASIALLLLLLITGCAVPHGHIRARDSAALRPGMSRADVIATLGQPEYAFTIKNEERLTYLLNRPSQGVTPFEVILLGGLVQRYGVSERDPGRVDPTVGNFHQEMAVPWYSPDDYTKVLVLLPADEAINPVTHDEWMVRTTSVENEIRNAGRVPVRVTVDPAELESWCKHHGVQVDKAAIAAYTEMRLGLERGRGVPTEQRDNDNDLLKKLLAVFTAGN